MERSGVRKPLAGRERRSTGRTFPEFTAGCVRAVRRIVRVASTATPSGSGSSWRSWSARSRRGGFGRTPSMRTGAAWRSSVRLRVAAADQLIAKGTRCGFERADRIGGLLRYGIPEFKMEKRLLDRRLAIMEQEGVVFRPGVDVGGAMPASALRSDFDATVLCGGATAPRDLPIAGRDLSGVHFAVDYLTQQNRRCEGDTVPPEEFISAEGRHVVIIGGGDTGADCLGTVHRQGALSVSQFEVMARPPAARAADNPWPQWPAIFRTSSAHEEGAGNGCMSVSTARFIGDAHGPSRESRRCAGRWCASPGGCARGAAGAFDGRRTRAAGDGLPGPRTGIAPG